MIAQSKEIEKPWKRWKGHHENRGDVQTYLRSMRPSWKTQVGQILGNDPLRQMPFRQRGSHAESRLTLAQKPHSEVRVERTRSSLTHIQKYLEYI